MHYLKREGRKMKTKSNKKASTRKTSTRKTVLELAAENMYYATEGKRNALTRKHGVSTSKEDFVQLVSYTYAYGNIEMNPKNILGLLEEAIKNAKRGGLKKLCQNSIVKIFEEEIRIFKNKQKNSPNYLKLIAYHEVGHFILNEVLKSSFGETLFITIICNNDYAGANIYSPNINQEETLNSIEEVKKEVAIFLAGDIACEIFLGKRNEGIVEDFEIATQIVHGVLLGTRMMRRGRYFGKSSYLVDGQIDYSYLSDKQKDELAKRTNKIMSDAEKMAKRILRKKKKQVKILVDALLERGALTGHQARLLYYGVLELSELPVAQIKRIK